MDVNMRWNAMQVMASGHLETLLLKNPSNVQYNQPLIIHRDRPSLKRFSHRKCGVLVGSQRTKPISTLKHSEPIAYKSAHTHSGHNWNPHTPNGARCAHLFRLSIQRQLILAINKTNYNERFTLFSILLSMENQEFRSRYTMFGGWKWRFRDPTNPTAYANMI